jgi:CheY-like chemotaxis protein
MAHRLLLADDSITIRKVIELTFADEGIDVVAVADGDTAIARLDAEVFDIVLADAAMPGRDGFQVAAHLMARPPEARVPIILLTGAFEPVDESRVALVGARAVLAKPFEPQVLVAKVREVLASPHGRTAPQAPAPLSPADTPLAAPPGPSEGQSPADYFARLDKAFAGLNVGLEPKEPGPLRRPRPAPAPEAPAPLAAPAAPVAAPPPPVAAAPLAVPDPPAARPELPTPSPAGSGLADAFGTLLAVEQGELPPSALDGPPAPGDDELVDRVARRVVEQLGDGAVRALATEIVSRTAERLVREEIDRIKSGLDRS